ncbi:hypothetical protein tb265_20340 [Gemmatimonadetes bacterium T265]|nr:hypothetical protein tb265_20340 [Gemmatimonadetes bacterium T265]
MTTSDAAPRAQAAVDTLTREGWTYREAADAPSPMWVPPVDVPPVFLDRRLVAYGQRDAMRTAVVTLRRECEAAQARGTDLDADWCLALVRAALAAPGAS